jgi:GT2 family glycosyltransferase
LASSSPLVSIIILNYNANQLIVDCVDSVLKSNYKNLEVILVDNASTDGSHKECKKKFDIIKLIENNENLGYCEGNNVGLREAKGQFIVVLNPDTIVEPNWLDELFAGYKKYGDGLYQPKLLATSEKNRINSAGNFIQIFGFGYSRGKGSLDS